MNEKDILSLPDEVKLQIFEYLDGISKQELSKVCSDFARIYQDRHVMQRLNFSKNYKTGLLHFNLRKPISLYKLVTYLNISSVYWIPSGQLRYALIKFIELNYLNVTDTQLTFRDLKTVLNATTKVTKLAISLRSDHCSDAIFLKIDNPISHFYVTYSSFSLRALYNVLANFAELDELWVIESPVPSIPVSITEPPEFLDGLPQVKNKFVMTKHSNKLAESLSFFERVKSAGNWLNIITLNAPIYLIKEKRVGDNNLPDFDPQNKIEEKFSFLAKVFGSYNFIFGVEDLEVIAKHRSYSSQYFSYLNLSRNPNFSSEVENNIPDLEKCFEAFETVLFAKKMSQLKKIKFGCLLMYNKKTVSTMVQLPLFKKPRIGTSSSKITDKCLFSRVTNYLTEIEDLEVINDFTNNVRMNKWDWQPDCLKFISNWKKLKYLTITAIPFSNGKFFIEIMKNCPELRRLKIKDTSATDKISYDLCTALKYAKNLLDFRYERDGCAPTDELFDALANCLNLERLYIQCHTTKSISKRPLETLLSVCERLVFFFVYIKELLETVCKTIKQSISYYDLKPVQFFTIRGRAYNLNNIMYDDVPAIHVREMVCQNNEFYEYLETF